MMPLVRQTTTTSRVYGSLLRRCCCNYGTATTTRVVAWRPFIIRGSKRHDHLLQEAFVGAANRFFTTSTTVINDDSQDRLVAATQRWFDLTVVGQKLCPFASPLIKTDDNDNNKLRIIASAAETVEQAALDVAAEAQFLLRGVTEYHHDSSHPETTLVVFDAPFVQNFRDFVRLSWTLQEKAVVDQGFADELQLVLFHPQATHQTYGVKLDDDDDDPADYTIRSPYPTVHLLREIDVMRAVTSKYPQLDQVPTRNKARLRAQGIEACRQRLQDCYNINIPSIKVR